MTCQGLSNLLPFYMILHDIIILTKHTVKKGPTGCGKNNLPLTV